MSNRRRLRVAKAGKMVRSATVAGLTATERTMGRRAAAGRRASHGGRQKTHRR